MTCRDKLKIEHPDKVKDHCAGGCFGCPHDYGYLGRPDCCFPRLPEGLPEDGETCTKCWDREIPGTKETKEKNMGYSTYLNTKTKEELIDIAINDDLRILDRDARISVMEKQIEELDVSNKRYLRTLESKNGRIGTLEQKVKNAERDARIANETRKGLVDAFDRKKARIIELDKKIESLTKDITFYRKEIDDRNQRLDEKEAKILNMQDTIDFQERHINRIEGELKLYKGMKVDTNKTDYTTKPEKVEPLCKYIPSNRVIGTLESAYIEEEGVRATFLLTEEAAECFMPNGLLPNLGSDIRVGDFVEPAKLRTMSDIDEMHECKGHPDPVGDPGVPGEDGIPICNSVPSSAVIGKIHSLNNRWGTNEKPEITFKIPRDAVKKLTGKDNWSDIDYLIMPTDIYKDVLNKDLEEHMIKYRDMVDQYRYYSRFLDTPHVTIPPVAKNYKEIADHTYNKFTALKNAGFTEDQAMQLIPMWIDDKEGDA